MYNERNLTNGGNMFPFIIINNIPETCVCVCVCELLNQFRVNIRARIRDTWK